MTVLGIDTSLRTLLTEITSRNGSVPPPPSCEESVASAFLQATDSTAVLPLPRRTVHETA